MPTKPQAQTLSATSNDILNAIRNTSSDNYRNYVPTADGTNLREIGAIIVGNPTLANEFITTLVNRIGMVIINSKMYENPWTMFKQGVLNYGETIEQIFVDLAKPFEFDMAVAENELYKRVESDVDSVFHILNYKKFYKVTVNEDMLRQAFLSESGVSDLVNRIIDSMYAGARYDEFLTMKYLLARHILNGELYAIAIPAVTKANAKDITIKIKEASNNLTFMSTKYDLAGVHNFTDKDNQYLILNSGFDSMMDVETLATAFNMSKADFAGKRTLVDNFGELDKERLNQLFGSSAGYTEITDAECQALNTIPAVLVDKNWFMIYDYMDKMTNVMNEQGLYWNHFYHVWKVFSVSPFHNALVFTPTTPSVTSVTVSPATATVSAGGSVALSAKVVTTGFASQAVKWSCDETKATVSFNGVVTVKDGIAKDTTITVTATSVADSSKSGTATITVA